MAAIPKLSPEQWGNARAIWEADPRKGFPWLIDELSLPVSAEAVRLRSKSEGWIKPWLKESMSLLPHTSRLPKVVIKRHRSEWDEHQAAFPLSALLGDVNKCNEGKAIAEMLMLRQEGEIKAWAVERGA